MTKGPPPWRAFFAWCRQGLSPPFRPPGGSGGRNLTPRGPVLQLRRPPRQPAIDRALFVAQRIGIGEPARAVVHEAQVGEFAFAFAQDLSLVVEQAEVQGDARRVDLLDHAYRLQ